VVADGTFSELKQKQGDNSLEQIFAHLTATESMSEASDKLMDIMANTEAK